MSKNQTNFNVQASEETGLACPVSRRCFFSLTAVVGALAFQGSALGGRVVAYADEAGHSHFSIYILSKYEVPVVVCDESSGTPQILSGAKVTLTSAVTGDTVSGVTRDDGFVPLNVKALSYQKDHDESDVFNFWGSAEVEMDGYRSFYVQSMYIEAGTPADQNGNRTNVVHLNTQADDGQPYLRSLTLDGADIMYVSQTSARVSDSNTIDHDLVAHVCMPESGQKVHVAILVNGEEVAAQDQVSGKKKPYLAKMTFTDKWLKKIKVGDTLSVRYGLASAASDKAASKGEGGVTAPQTDDGAAFEFISPLKFEEPVLISEEGSATIMASPTSSNDGDDSKQRFLPMPKWLMRSGDSASIDFPFMPFSVFFDAYGYFGFSEDLATVGFLKRKNGDDVLAEKGRVHTFIGDTGKDAWAGYKAKVSNAWEYQKYLCVAAELSGPKRPSIGVGLISTDIDVKFHFVLKGQGHTEKEKGSGTYYSTADIVLMPQFVVAFSATQQFQAGPFPLFWTFDLGADLTGKLLFGIEFEDLFKKINWSHHTALGLPAVPSFVIAMHLEAGFTLGVGVSGVLSAGIRGYGFLNFNFNFAKVKGKPFPMTKIHLAAGVQVRVQALFFNKTFKVVQSPELKLYDNTENKKLSYSDTPTLTSAEFDPSDAVSDSDLTHMVETKGGWSFANSDEGFWPSYDAIAAPASTANMVDATFVDPSTVNDGIRYNPINGLRPSVQERLWDGAFTNPRMRIVHTDTKSFKNDRAFLVRIAVVGIEVPGSVNDFASGAWYENGQATNASDLGIQDIGGNQFVKPLDQVTSAANGTAVNRTRVTISEWDKAKCTWGEVRVVDFLVEGEVYESDRLNSHDVDFDVELYDGAIYLAITSLKRPEKVDATFAEYVRRQYVSLVRWDIDKGKTVAAGSSASHLGTGKSLYHPRILMQTFDTAGRKDQMCAVVYSFACTYDKDGDVDTCNIAATVYDDLTSGGLSDHRLSNPTNILSKQIKIDPQTLSEGTFEVACPDRSMTVWDEKSGRNQSTVVLSWSHPATEDVAATSFVTSQTYSIVIEGGSGSSKHKSFVTQHDRLDLDEIPALVKLGVMDQKGLFSYADVLSENNTKPLSMVTYDKDTRKLDLIPSTGDTDKLKYFSSFNGRRLYTVRIMEGDHPGLPEDFRQSVEAGAILSAVKSPYNSPNAMMDNAEDMAGSKVQLYQLLEARWVDELQTYYDFYPIAQLTVPPENIGVISVSKTRTDFTFSYVYEAEDKKETADIYQAAVPAITVGETGQASANSPFAAPGDLCWYNIEITNVGNTPITEMTMRITDANGKEVAKDTFKDLAPYVQESADSAKAVRDSNGERIMEADGLVASEQVIDQRDVKGILWPGKTRTYCFSFKVPEGYEKDVTFNVDLADAKDNMEDLDQFSAFHDAKANASDGFLISPADYVQSDKDASPASLSYSKSASISFCIDTEEQKEYRVNQPNGETLSKQDEDEGFPWGTLGLGAAAALGLGAAALTAYSKRRVKNEQDPLPESNQEPKEEPFQEE